MSEHFYLGVLAMSQSRWSWLGIWLGGVNVNVNFGRTIPLSKQLLLTSCSKRQEFSPLNLDYFCIHRISHVPLIIPPPSLNQMYIAWFEWFSFQIRTNDCVAILFLLILNGYGLENMGLLFIHHSGGTLLKSVQYAPTVSLLSIPDETLF